MILYINNKIQFYRNINIWGSEGLESVNNSIERSSEFLVCQTASHMEPIDQINPHLLPSSLRYKQIFWQ